MSSPTRPINCPNCGHEFDVSASLAQQIETDLRAELAEQRQAEEKRLAARESALAEQQARIEADAARQEQTVQTEVTKRLEVERVQTETKLREEISSQLADELTAQQQQITELTDKVTAARETELALRKRERELNDRSKDLELEVERKLAEKSDEIETQTAKRLEEKYQLTVSEKNQKLESLTKQVDDLKRKLEQGSQQTQGEVLELELERRLAEAFRYDELQPVPKGVEGGDCVQVVRNESGVVCGRILWEAKRTKHWSDKWIAKLKRDATRAKAQLAVICSTALPDGFVTVENIDGIWVTDFTGAIGIARVLRQQLILLQSVQRANEDRSDKVARVYDYLYSDEFKQKVEMIVASFETLQNEIAAERNAMNRIWSRREQHLRTVIESTTGMIGDIQGITHGSEKLPLFDDLLPLDSDTEDVARPQVRLTLTDSRNEDEV